MTAEPQTRVTAPFNASVATRDLIMALSRSTNGPWRYAVIAVAGAVDGLVTATVRATTADGPTHEFAVAICLDELEDAAAT